MLPAMVATVRQPAGLGSRLASPFATSKDQRRSLSQRSATTSGAGLTRAMYGRERLGSETVRAGLNTRRYGGYKTTRVPSKIPRAISERLVEPSASGGDNSAAGERSEDFESQRVELLRLRPLRDAILNAGSDLGAKERALASDPCVKQFMEDNGPVARVLRNIDSEDAYLVKSLVAAGQKQVLTSNVASEDPLHVANALRPLCDTLRQVETFYDMLGGVVGYQFAALELIHQAYGGPFATTSKDLDKSEKSETSEKSSTRDVSQQEFQMHVPPGPDLREGGGEYARLAASWGLEELPNMAEIYPLGGAGDRLGLTDEKTGESLPAALLNYNGRTLLEGLLRDLQAREWLYYKVFGRQITTPVAIMTSAAKGNHGRISNLIESNDFFGRGESGFRLFEQPLVPVVTVKGGKWVTDDTSKEMSFALKPGGHGAIWKLMSDQGVFTWLGAKNKSGAVVRQITNPMAGTDTTIFALSGVGARGKKAMGFASCERHLGAAEGVNVLTERGPDDQGRYSYGVSNVEYTVLQNHGISDDPVEPGSKEARFPANTNVLYIGLEQVKTALEKSPRGAFPGMLVNLSKPVTKDGVKGGRLETSMQNIADALEGFSEPGKKLNEKEWEDLPTFVLYSSRRRITSSAKKKRDVTQPPSVKNLAQTPDGSFLDLLRNAADLLDRCHIKHPNPEGGDVHAYLQSGPGFIFHALPALGPLWDVTSQKIKNGVLHDRTEVRLEVAEMQWNDVEVEGSLLVSASEALGGSRPVTQKSNSQNKSSSLTVFDDTKCGRVRLRDVVVTNKGVDWAAQGTQTWSATLTRHESCSIIVEGDSEFCAKGVALDGDVKYVVPPGTRLELRPGPDGPNDVAERWTDLTESAPSWQWKYVLGVGGKVELTMEECAEAEKTSFETLRELEQVRAAGKENQKPLNEIEAKGFTARNGSAGEATVPKTTNRVKNSAPTSR